MSKKIESLTPQQTEMIPKYLDRYKKIGLSTEPCDHPKAEEALTRAYLYLKMKPPKIMWCDSPFKGAKLAAQALLLPEGQYPTGNEEVSLKDVREQASKASFGSFEAYWVSFYAFIAEQLPVQKDELIDITKSIVENCGVYWTFNDLVIVSEKPIAMHFNDNGQLHNPNGLALEYKNGDGIAALNGVRHVSLLGQTIDQHTEKSV